MPAEMAKLYFKYGAMGSSKTAQALITKFNYEERGMDVWLLKPSVDSRDGETLLRSRIGLEATADVVRPEDDIRALYAARGRHDVVIVDECQFLTPEQIEQLRQLVDEENLPVLCFGLRTDFLTHLFPGSRRLFALAARRPRSTPALTARVMSSPRARRCSSAGTTRMSPCATPAGANALRASAPNAPGSNVNHRIKRRRSSCPHRITAPLPAISPKPY